MLGSKAAASTKFVGSAAAACCFAVLIGVVQVVVHACIVVFVMTGLEQGML